MAANIASFAQFPDHLIPLDSLSLVTGLSDDTHDLFS